MLQEVPGKDWELLTDSSNKGGNEGRCPLDLTFTNKEGLTGDVKDEGCLGYSDSDMVEVKIHRAVTRAKSKLTTQNSGRADETTWVILRNPVG